MRHLGASFAGTGLIQALNLVSGVLAARLLLPEGRGELAAVLLWPSIIAAVGCLSIDQAITYTAARQPAAAPRLFKLGLGLAVALAAATLAVATPLLPYLYRNHTPEVAALARLYLLVSVPTFGLSLIATGLLQGLLKIAAWNIARTIQPLLYVGAILLLVALGAARVEGFVHASLGAGVLALLVAIWLCFRSTRPAGTGPAVAPGPIVKYSLTVHLGGLMAMLASRLDMMLIALLLAAADLGLYAVAMALASPIAMIASTLVPLAFPKIANQATLTGKAEVLGRYLRLGLAMGLTAGLCLMAAGPWLLELLFGPAFLPAVVPFRLLLTASVVGGLRLLLGAGLKAGGRPGLVNRVDLPALALAAVAMPILLMRFGLPGAAGSLILVNTVAALHSAILVRHLFQADFAALFVPTRADWHFVRRRLAETLRR